MVTGSEPSVVLLRMTRRQHFSSCFFSRPELSFTGFTINICLRVYKNSLLHDQNQLFPFPFLQKSIVFCLLCFLHKFIAFLPTWPLALLLPDYPTACARSAPCFQFSFWPNYNHLQIFFIWALLLLQPKFAAEHIQASEGEQFQCAKAHSWPTCSSAPWTPGAVSAHATGKQLFRQAFNTVYNLNHIFWGKWN